MPIRFPLRMPMKDCYPTTTANCSVSASRLSLWAHLKMAAERLGAASDPKSRFKGAAMLSTINSFVVV
eukprot:scaffold2585_cov135-Cylindrotheca_fusiformis.AAC.1